MYPVLTLLKSGIEVITPAFDNNIVDIALTMPPELRMNHVIYRKFLKKLSPELMNITYNRSMIRPNSPYIFWNLGKSIQKYINYVKRQIYRITKGKWVLLDKQTAVPFDDFFRNDEDWINFFKDLLMNKNAMIKNYINQSYIEELFRMHQTGKTNFSHKLLYLASLEIFLQTFMKKTNGIQ
jgi:asparagine synthase (glutamine-hydrolysing)